jgi:hypothetical protein
MYTAYLIEITHRDGTTSRIVCSERTPTLNQEWADYRVVRTATGATYAAAAAKVNELSGISGDLARRAVACKGWRVMPGMADVSGACVCDVFADGTALICLGHYQCGCLRVSAFIPDLTDPATLGCLLALVREQYQDATTQIDSGRWWVAAYNGAPIAHGDTEAEALVAALEGAL